MTNYQYQREMDRQFVEANERYAAFKAKQSAALKPKIDAALARERYAKLKIDKSNRDWANLVLSAAHASPDHPDSAWLLDCAREAMTTGRTVEEVARHYVPGFQLPEIG